MLADKALKQKIIDADSQNDTIIEIIESEFATLATTYKTEITRRQSIHNQEKHDLETQIQILASKVQALEKKPTHEKKSEYLEKATSPNQAKPNNSSHVDHTESETVIALQTRVRELEKDKEDNLKLKQLRIKKISFVALFIITPILLASGYYNLIHPLVIIHFKLNKIVNYISLGISFYLLLIISAVLSKLFIEGNPPLEKWWFFKLLSTVAAKIIIPIVVALITFKDEIISFLGP